MSLSILILWLKDWNDRRWKKEVVFCLIDPSKSASNSTIGSGSGEVVCHSPLVPGSLFRVFLIRDSHFLAGPLSSVPKTLPALRGTISWNLSARKVKLVHSWTVYGERREYTTHYTNTMRNLPKNIDISRRRRVKPIFQTQITWRRFSSYIPSGSKDSVCRRKE